MNVEPHLSGRDAQGVHERGSEWHHRYWRGVDAEQKVQHRHVADHDRLIRARRSHARLGVELIEDSVDRRHDRVPELVDAVRAVHRVADARDDVGAERRLAVEGGTHRGGHPCAQVHQRPDQRCRADVERDPEAFLGGVARLDRHQLLAGQHRRDLEARVAQRHRQRAQHGHARGHVVAFRGESVAQPRYVAALVLEVRLGQLEVDLPDVGVDDDEAAQAHRRGLGHTQQLRHLANQVFVDACLARESPAVVGLVLA